MVLAAVSPDRAAARRPSEDVDPRRASRATSAAAPGTTTSSRRSRRAAGGGVMSATETDRASSAPPSSARRTRRCSRGRGHVRRQHDAAGDASCMVVVRSPYAHARITSVDVDAARAAEGVVAVFTGADLADDWKAAMPVRLAGDRGHEEPAALPARGRRGPLPGRRRRRRDRRDAARSRRTRPSSSRSTTSRSPRSSTSQTALEDGAPLVHEDLGTNECYVWKLETDDVDRLRSTTPTSSSSAATSSRALIPNAIEPRGVRRAGRSPDGDVTLWSATQIPHILRVARRGDARHARDEAARDRPGRRRRLRLEARRLRRGAARRRARAPARRAR